MQDINLQIEGLKRRIIDDVNKANLPAAVIYYVISDVYKNIEKEYFNLIENLSTQPQVDNTTENED